MREQFLNWLDKKASQDKNIILVVGDMGFGFTEKFQENHPNQFWNCGITEQSFMGAAAGLAIAGMKPYVYSCINFVTMRNYEQLRNDICYQSLNVKIIGVQGSVHYKFLGPSHNIVRAAEGRGVSADEDISILSMLPNLETIISDNEKHLENVLEKLYKIKHPCYLRI